MRYFKLKSVLIQINFYCGTLLISLPLQSQPNFGITGFATENGGTTGGQGGTTVTVSDFSNFKKYAESTAKYIIMVDSTITNGVGGALVNIGSNKTIKGVGSSAFLQGVGLAINNSNNIIIQNIKITMVGLTTPKNTNDGDCISIYGNSKNIWIDHCELYSENPDTQTDIDKYDGLIDIKHQTGFITVSWCYLHDHWKCGLVGAADNDLNEDRKITYHHNYYNKVKLRMPMYRGSEGHFYNNYLVGAKDATEIRANTCVRVERNYYEKLHYSIYTPSDSPGKTERINNIEVDHASRAYPANCIADIPYDYSQYLTYNTEAVKTLVPQYAGIGKIDNIQGNPPTVAITSPAINDTLFDGTDITLSADASDDGSVARVEFFNGNKSLGFDEEAPFSITLNNARKGTYNITAVATDDQGGNSPSSAIAFTVVERPVNSIYKNIGNNDYVQIYPVPADDFLKIEFNKDLSEDITLHLYDLTGKKIKSAVFNDEVYTLDLYGLKKGLYIVELAMHNVVITSRFVKQ